MGVDYSYYLVFGFEIDEDLALAPFKKQTKDEGEFHLEDRFDPKTGAKTKPHVVWDRKPSKKTWYEVNGEEFSEDFPMEHFDSVVGEFLGCEIESCGSWPSGELTKVFHVNKSMNWKDADNYGRHTIYNNEMSASELPDLIEKAKLLKEKMEKLGYKVKEPTIFIAGRVS